MPIPEHGLTGILPPYVDQTSMAGYAPYSCELVELVECFGTSKKRVELIGGLLSYRAALHEVGLVNGLQWLDGSFVEELEPGRQPSDIDMVTLYRPPNDWNDPQVQAKVLALPISNDVWVKATYGCDVYYVGMGGRLDLVVRQLTYWHGFFSHRRTLEWKGMLQIDLAPSIGDALARQRLSELVFE